MLSELSIIIPCLNEEHYLPKLLDSLTRQNFTGKMEVLVVDGQSEDKTVDRAKEFNNKIQGLRVISIGRGTARQRNFGAVKAKYNILLFMDADDRLPDHYLNKLVGKVNDARPFVVSVPFLPSSGGLLDYIFIPFAYMILFCLSLINPLTPGGFFMTRKEEFLKIGGFAEDSILFEDVDCGRRLIKGGAHWHFFPTLPIYSSARRAKELGLWKLFLLYVKAFWYVQKHGPITKDSGFDYPYGHYKGD